MDYQHFFVKTIFWILNFFENLLAPKQTVHGPCIVPNKFVHSGIFFLEHERAYVRKLGNDTFTSCQSIIITVTYGPGTLTWYFYMKNWVWYQNNQLDELIPMVPFTPFCQILTNLDTFSDPTEIFDLRNIFFFFNKPLQNLGSICWFTLGSDFDFRR